MAVSRAANVFDKVAGKDSAPGGADTAQDITNPDRTDETGHPSGETMKALAWIGKNSIEMVQVPRPKIMEDRDVILKVTGSTVCGSDLHLLHGAILQLQKGDILGHEFCGIVDETGPGVTNLSKGQRVVASFQIACGDCFYCARKLSSQCERTNSNALEHSLYGSNTAGMFGYSHLTGGFAGGQAEYVRVPMGDVNLLKLPDDVPDEKGLYLSDVLATSYHAVLDTGVEKNDVVAVWGAGPIGEMVVAFALQVGAKKVIVIDNVRWRIEKLENMKQAAGKVVGLNFAELPKDETVVSQLKKMVDGRGPDVAIECAAGEYAKSLLHKVEIAAGMETDTSELINEMIEGVRNFGMCGVTGVYAGYTNHFNIGSLMERGIRLIGNGQAPVHLYWEKLLKMIQNGDIDPLQMISHRVRIDDLKKVYDMFEKKEDNMQKVFVETRFSAPKADGSPELTVLA